jgi:hypothetical protein
LKARPSADQTTQRARQHGGHRDCGGRRS